MTKKDWRTRAYEEYVSSGQAKNINTDNPFASRSAYIKAIIKKHVPQNRNIAIVDLGCGSGAYLYFLRKEGYKAVSGVDTSEEQVAIAHKLGLSSVECNDIDTYIANMPPRSVDIVLLIDIIEHLDRQEIFSLLDEINKLLKPGGKCLIHVPNAEGLFGMRIRYGDITHETAFTPKSITQILQLAGFSEIQCFEDKPIPLSINGALRRIVWESTTFPARLLLIAETGEKRFILSQNMLVSGMK